MKKQQLNSCVNTFPSSFFFSFCSCECECCVNVCVVVALFVYIVVQHTVTVCIFIPSVLIATIDTNTLDHRMSFGLPCVGMVFLRCANRSRRACETNDECVLLFLFYCCHFPYPFHSCACIHILSPIRAFI